MIDFSAVNYFQKIKEYEGLKLKPYSCPAGKLTIGYGRNLEDRGISVDEADYLFKNDIKEIIKKIENKYNWYQGLNDARKFVIIDMCFNLGMGGFHSFKNMRTRLSEGNFELASKEMLNSKWAKQVGTRASEDARIMRLGKIERL